MNSWKKIIIVFVMCSSGYCHDTLSYNLNWGTQFIMPPGESGLVVFKLYKGAIGGINIPINSWGTGDQQLSIEIYNLKYPYNFNGDIYPIDSVDSNGWLGGWHDGIDFDSLSIDSTDIYNIWNQFPNDEGICVNTDIIPNSTDPLGEKLWPPEGNEFIMTPNEYPDIINGGTNFWIDIPGAENPTFECDGNYIGIMVRSIGSGGGDDPNTGFLYADASPLNLDFWPFLKFYNPCNGTSGEGGWHIRHWVMNWGISFEYLGDRPPYWDITCSPPAMTLSTDSVHICAAMYGWDTYCDGLQDSAELRYSIDESQTWITQEMSIKDTIFPSAPVTYYDLEWEGYIPGQPPGTQIIWEIVLLSSESDAEQSSQQYYYSIFDPIEGNDLIYNNQDPLYGNLTYSSYLNFYWNGEGFDIWDARSGPLSSELIDHYTTVIELTGNDGPVYYDHDEVIKEWWNDTKTYIVVGDEWLGIRYGSDNNTIIPEGDVARTILGIDKYYPDINYMLEGDQEGISRLIPDSSGASSILVDFLFDSLQLNYDPIYATDNLNRLDGFEVVYGYTVDMTAYSGVLDSNGNVSDDAEIYNVMIHGQAGNGGKSAFLAFDPIALNTTPSYYWIGASSYWNTIHPNCPPDASPLVSVYEALQGIVSIGDEMKQPTAFSLKGNYPNPFNPITNIHYELPINTRVKITIYDILGREVKSLLNTQQTAGEKTIQWNARNDLGLPVSAGVYLYQIQAGDFVQTKKMVLLK